MSNNLNVIYRISDKGNPKAKLKNGGKIQCIENAIKIFGKNNIHVIADNCEVETIAILNKFGLSLEITSNGNSGTCVYIFRNVVHRYAPEDNLYLLEDDYLHLPNSKEAILEGLEIADYVTLYDHPDMYHRDGNGDNPFVHGDFPKSSIYLSKHTHWRSVVSTTMTFAAKAKTLIEDSNLWCHFCQGKIPADFLAFVLLTKQTDFEDMKYFAKTNKNLKSLVGLMLEGLFLNHPKRTLISSIPGMSTHTEVNFLSPIVDWQNLGALK